MKIGRIVYNNPRPSVNPDMGILSRYTIYLEEEIQREDWEEALRSVALLTYDEPIGTELFLPVEVIAILLLEEQRYPGTLEIVWDYVFPVT